MKSVLGERVKEIRGMSVVTNIILTFSVLEPERRLDEVNTFFGERNGFVSCDDPSLPIGWYGGSKMLETNVAISSFNHLDLQELVAHLETMEWEERENVQLFVQGEDDERFRVIELTQNNLTP